MSVSILEALYNAEHNMKEPFTLKLAQSQLHNAIILLEKGYSADTEVEPLLEQYGDVENVPGKAKGLDNQYPWISVKDSLPEKRIRVLAWEGTITWEAYIDFDGKWKWSHVDGDLHPTDHITHWAPLPSMSKS